jgi:hypothetical protein
VRELLSTDAGQQALKSAKMDYQRVDKAIGQLSDEDLAKVAERSRQAESDFAAGGLKSTLIIVIVLIVILIIVLSLVFWFGSALNLVLFVDAHRRFEVQRKQECLYSGRGYASLQGQRAAGFVCRGDFKLAGGRCCWGLAGRPFHQTNQ